MQQNQIAPIPMSYIGPIQLIGPVVQDAVSVPLATFETPLWPSTNRGAKISRLCREGGIFTTIISDCMTRSVVVQGKTAHELVLIVEALKNRTAELSALISQSSRYAKLKNWHFEIVGNLLYLRWQFETGAASGHNMATHGAEQILNWILTEYPSLKYVSISANYCIDKKVSAVNGILGRGKSVVAEAVIPKEIVETVLKTTPAKIVDLHIKKNLIGTCLAGGLRTANAHFGNMLLAFYLATGQDGVNIIEASQGMVHTEVRPDGDLYFSVNLPNLILGTVGNGKHLDFVQENLKILGCLPNQMQDASASSQRLAAICAATVWCGELSLLAAQTNPGELMRTHMVFERAENNPQIQTVNL